MIYYYKKANEDESLDVFQLHEVWKDGENITYKLDLGKFFDDNEDVEKYIANVVGEDVMEEGRPQ